MAIWLWVPAGAAALAFGPSPSRTASPGTPSRSGSADATTKTRAIFYTESDYNPSVSGWVGRLSVLRAATPESPRWVADATNPTGLAVDSLRGRVYWTDPGDASIHTCLADGTDHSLVAAGTFGHRMNDGPFGIAVDEQAESLIWSAVGHGTLRRSDLLGNEIAALPVGQSEWTASGPWGIATLLRPLGQVPPASRPPPTARSRGRGGGGEWVGAQASGSVFWTCWGRIRSCQLGSSVVTDVVKGLLDPRGIAIDRARGRLFWTDYRAGKVQCANLDGSRMCDVATGLSSPFGIAVGPNRIFWTDRKQGAIYSACLRKGTVRKVLDGLHQPEGIAVFNSAGGHAFDTEGGGRHETEGVPAGDAAGGGRAVLWLGAGEVPAERNGAAPPLSGAARPGAPHQSTSRNGASQPASSHSASSYPASSHPAWSHPASSHPGPSALPLGSAGDGPSAPAHWGAGNPRGGPPPVSARGAEHAGRPNTGGEELAGRPSTGGGEHPSRPNTGGGGARGAPSIQEVMRASASALAEMQAAGWPGIGSVIPGGEGQLGGWPDWGSVIPGGEGQLGPARRVARGAVQTTRGRGGGRGGGGRPASRRPRSGRGESDEGAPAGPSRPATPHA